MNVYTIIVILQIFAFAFCQDYSAQSKIDHDLLEYVTKIKSWTEPGAVIVFSIACFYFVYGCILTLAKIG